MAKVIAVSSQVTRGRVGLSALIPALLRLGHDVWPLPTILLSNHPGHGTTAGVRIEAGALERMIDALEANGWLGEVDAIVTGYLPSVAHVAFAASLVARVKALRPDAVHLCDPVIGDHETGIYIDDAAAAAIKSALIGGADITTPNSFELSYLSATPIDTAADALKAAQTLACPKVVVTSAPDPEGHEPPRRTNILVDGAVALFSHVPDRAVAPRGTGDLFAGLLLGFYLSSSNIVDALGRATAVVDTVLTLSEGHDELQLPSWDGTWSQTLTLSPVAILEG